MNKANISNILILSFLVVLGTFPSTISAQSTCTGNNCTAQVQLANGQTSQTTIGVPEGFTGVFSCNQNGAYALSVGALGAIGGVFVPVADAAVELNTGTLVYKECVLREVVDAERQAATAGITQTATQEVQTGRGGAPLYVTQPSQELTTGGVNAAVAAIQNNLNSVDPAIRQPVVQSVARGVVASVYNAPAALGCPYQGSASDFANNTQQASIFDDIAAVGSDCNPFWAAVDSNNYVMSNYAQAQQILQNEWLQGGGYYPVTTGGNNPLTQQIVTPSSLVDSSYAQILQSGFAQLQNANDLGQMVGALFAGISSQVLYGNGGGVTGLTQPIGSQPSYLQQAVQQASKNLQANISNAALANLQAALSIEKSYYDIMNTIAGTLTSTISQLRSAENTCWSNIIQQACAGPVTYQNGKPICVAKVTCTTTFSAGTICPTGATLHIATSTEFSQPIISANISALASTTAQNLNVSQQALALINQLIQNVQSSSADSQAVAIEQLNQLIVNKELHTQADLTTAQNQEQSVNNAMTDSTSGLLITTVNRWAGENGTNDVNGNPNKVSWGGSTNSSTSNFDLGWCNTQDSKTIQEWAQIWSQ